MLKRFNKQAGFTLIELLVVVAILGVLAAVVVPNVINFMDDGNEAAVKANTASIQTAVDAYVADGDGHAYPDVEQLSLTTVPDSLVPDYLNHCAGFPCPRLPSLSTGNRALCDYRGISNGSIPLT